MIGFFITANYNYFYQFQTKNTANHDLTFNFSLQLAIARSARALMEVAHDAIYHIPMCK